MQNKFITKYLQKSLKPYLADHKATPVTKKPKEMFQRNRYLPNAVMHLWLKSYGGQYY